MWCYWLVNLLRTLINVLDFNKPIILKIFLIIAVSHYFVCLIVCYITIILLRIVTINLILTFENIILIIHNTTILYCVFSKMLKIILLLLFIHINTIYCLLAWFLSHRLISCLLSRCICCGWFIHKLELLFLPFNNSSVTLHPIIQILNQILVLFQ